MILALRKEGRTLKIVAIRNRAPDVQNAMNADGTLERSSAGEPITRQDWLARVQPILREVLRAETPAIDLARRRFLGD